MPINLGEFSQSPRNDPAAHRGALARMADTLDLMAQYGATGTWTESSASGVRE